MDVKLLPKAKYITVIKCPKCGWYGGYGDETNIYDDCEIIKIKATNNRAEFYHCMSCKNRF